MRLKLEAKFVENPLVCCRKKLLTRKFTKSFRYFVTAVDRMFPHSLRVLGTIEQEKVFSEILANIKNVLASKNIRNS